MTLLRRSLIAAAALVALLLAAVVVLTLVVDPNVYRDEIEAAVAKASGRQFDLTGDIEIAWLPWLALETGAAQLGNPHGIDAPPLLAWDGARIGVRAWPLVRGRLVVDRVRFDGLRVHLRAAADGRTNWQSFGAQRGAGGSRAMLIPENAGLQIRDGALEYVDERTGRKVAIRDWDLDVGAYHSGEPVPVRTAFRYREIPVAMSIPGLTLDLERLRIAAPAWTLAVGEARFDGAFEAHEQLARMQGELRGQVPSVRALLTGLGGDAPRTRDAGAYGALRVAGSWRYQDGGVQVQPLEIKLDDTTLSGSVSRSADASPAGAGSTGARMWSFELRGDRIDLDRYREPDDAKGKPFELPTAALKAAKVRGTLAFDSARVAGVDAKDLTLRVITGKPAT
ncbi:MAG TPA: AsmA family protein [Steroidobacteraceae bacterium]|nr:AsmA family protein [Steroidobacteraceae bacterium]